MICFGQQTRRKDDTEVGCCHLVLIRMLSYFAEMLNDHFECDLVNRWQPTNLALQESKSSANMFLPLVGILDPLGPWYSKHGLRQLAQVVFENSGYGSWLVLGRIKLEAKLIFLDGKGQLLNT